MKIVPAKCPSCGANIEVDQNGTQTICDFCGSTIMIQEAIQKVQISGEIEVKNGPKLENYLKIGNRHFEDKEYDEAYTAFSSAIDMDPDNSIAILKKGLSRTLSFNVTNLDMTYFVNAIKNAFKTFKGDNDSKEKLVDECQKGIYSVECHVSNMHKPNLSYAYVANIINALFTCLSEYEFLYEKTSNNEKEEIIANRIISCVKNIKKSRVYAVTGSTARKPFCFKKEQIVRLNDTVNQYKNELISINPEKYDSKTISKQAGQKSTPKKSTAIMVVELFFPVLFCAIFLLFGNIVSFLLMTLFCIFIMPECYGKIFEPEGTVPSGWRIALLIFLFFAAFYYQGIFIDNNGL